MDGIKTDDQGTEKVPCECCGNVLTRFEGESYALCVKCAWREFQRRNK